MIASYNICEKCTELIDNSSGIWRDIDGHSFSLIPLTGTGQFIYHRHMPMDDQAYRGHGKYDSLDAEILDALAVEGYASDSLGDQPTFGFYDLFSDYNAILYSRPDGSVTVTFYDSAETTEFAWGSLEKEYEEFDSEDDDSPCDCGAITYQCDCNTYAVPYEDEDLYAYESGAYESDLWD